MGDELVIPRLPTLYSLVKRARVEALLEVVPKHLSRYSVQVGCLPRGSPQARPEGSTRLVDVFSVILVARAKGDQEADLPRGVVEPLVTPENVLVGISWS